MNKKVIIISVLGLIGVGAFFYFKPKSKANETDSSGGALGSTSGNADLSGTTSVPPTGTVLSTPEQVQETAKKIAEARSLATQVSELRAKRIGLMSSSSQTSSQTSNNSFLPSRNLSLFSRKTQIAGLEKQIKDLDEKLGLLGYAEVNGGITKIV
jgi:hypothetical protein